jgi:hypothetical protein
MFQCVPIQDKDIQGSHPLPQLELMMEVPVSSVNVIQKARQELGMIICG